MTNQKNKFISKSVKDNIVLTLFNCFKQKDYIYYFSQDNKKNDIYITILNYNKLQSDLFNKYVFSNINGIYYHSILKLISMLNNFINNNIEKTELLIIYNINGYLIYLKN